MPLPRFRVRTLMIAVGVVASLIWGAMMASRSYDDFRRTREYGANEGGWRIIAARNQGRTKIGPENYEFNMQCGILRAVGREVSPGHVAPLGARRTRPSRTRVRSVAQSRSAGRKRSFPIHRHPGILRPKVGDRG